MITSECAIHTPEKIKPDSEINERMLILQCKRGDKHAYGELVKKYMQRAYYIALGLIGSHEGALDMSQKAFVRAYRAMKKVDPDKKFFSRY